MHLFSTKRFFYVAVLCLFGGALFLFCYGTAAAMGTEPRPYAVGVRSLSVLTPDNAQLGVVVWYPSSRSNQASYHTKFDRWNMSAEKNAPAAKVHSPVILLSHDMVSSNLAQHELATYLASSGFIVIAPTHTGDSSDGASALYSAALMYFRPMQMHEAARAVAASPQFEGMLDMQRVGLLGVGAGALTTLQLCGVDLDTADYNSYCSTENDIAVCSNWAKARFAYLAPEMREIRLKHGKTAFVAPMANVKAVGLLTPGWTIFARKAEVAALRVPVAALFAGQDGFYASAKNGDDVLKRFPRPLYDAMNYRILEQADHFSLSSECSEEMLTENSDMCGRISGSERKKLAEVRNNYFSSFFLAALGMPMPRQ